MESVSRRGARTWVLRGAPVRRSPLGGPCPALELGGGRRGEWVVCCAQHREGAESATAPAWQPPWPRAPGRGRSVGGHASGAAGEQKQKKRRNTLRTGVCRMLSRRGSLTQTTKVATPRPTPCAPACTPVQQRVGPPSSEQWRHLLPCPRWRSSSDRSTLPKKKPRKRCAPKHNNTPRVARGPSPSWP